jgi:hypothetical protein
LRERFIKNKRPLNLAYIFPKKKKQPETMTTRKTILMSKFDDEERETLLKRQGRQEDIAMKGSINLQQAIKLLRKQQQQH